MRLEAECPRCPALVRGDAGRWECPTHQRVTPLWRAVNPRYEEFAEHIELSRGLPSWVPWPLPIDWRVIDYGCVGAHGVEPQASFVTCAGPDELDGLVQVTVVSEEPGVGLGARCGGVQRSDPGRDAEEPPPAKVRVDGGTTPLWLVSTSDDGSTDALDRAVLAGEALGRWFWLVLRPASALLSLPQLPPLVDASGLGPQLLTLPFGKVPRAW
jgi:hypothetical protein